MVVIPVLLGVYLGQRLRRFINSAVKRILLELIRRSLF